MSSNWFFQRPLKKRVAVRKYLRVSHITVVKMCPSPTRARETPLSGNELIVVRATV